MKKKILLFISMTFFLVACPTKEEDIYINLNSFNIQASCSNYETQYYDTITCINMFKIYLYFKSSPIAQSTMFYTNFSVTYATYEPFVNLQNKIVKCTIINTEVFINQAANSEINNHFEFCIDDSNWIKEVSMVEGINEAVKLQYDMNVKPYLKLNSNSIFNYSGKFVVQLELSDGTLLSDTTQNIIINNSK